MLRKLLLAALLAVACQSKPDLPQIAKRIAADRANAMVIVGNQAAASRILQMRFSASPGGPAAPR